MPLVQPTKRDRSGMAGRGSANPRFPRVRRIKPKPILPKAVKKAVKKFGNDVLYGSK